MPSPDARRPVTPSATAADPETRAGYVTLVGRPNAGKSTLLNALVGEKLSIVTAKAQTTWQRVTGIHTSDGVQMIFLDTPGLLDVRDLLQRSMLAAALEALREADVVLLVLDSTRPLVPDEKEVLERSLSEARAPLVAAVNKVDVADQASVETWAAWARDAGARVHRISALTGEGLEELEGELREALPEGPFLYPEEDIASAPVRFFVAEMVRETVFERFRQEIPYSVFCQVEAFREGEDPVYIQVNVFVEKPSQKRILIGKGGSAIREVGIEARRKIEEFLGRSVYLDLWVKVADGWRRKRAHMKRFGFRVPDDDDAPTGF